MISLISSLCFSLSLDIPASSIITSFLFLINHHHTILFSESPSFYLLHLYQLSIELLKATTNAIASGSNTNMIIRINQLIITSIGFPNNPLKYSNGPNSEPTSTLVSISNICNWIDCSESAAICLLDLNFLSVLFFNYYTRLCCF
jgi:hypothetical protein